MPHTNEDLLPQAESTPRVERSARWWWYVALGLLVAMPYVGTFDAQFTLVDGETNILANPHVFPPSWEGLRYLWTHDYFGQYVPLSYTCWAMQVWASTRTDAAGKDVLDPWLFHFVNVVLHALCVMLVFAVLRVVVADDIAAFMGSLLFAWHPMQVESVAWISEMRGPLSAMFSLASIYEYLRFRGQGLDTPSPATREIEPGRSPWWRYLFAVTLYGLALLAKLSAASVPLILLAIDILWLRDRPWRSFLRLSWWFLPVALLAWVTRTAQTESIAEYVFVPPMWQRVLVALDSFLFYGWKFLVPWGLSLDYGRTPDYVLSSSWIWVTALLAIVMLAILVWSRSRVWLTGAAIFVAAVAPVCGLIPRAAQTFSTVADHYLYLGVLGPAWIFAWLLAQPRGKDFRKEVALLLVLLALLTARQTGYWHDTRTLAEHLQEINPTGVIGPSLLAKVSLAEGDDAQAEIHLRRAAEVGPARPVISWGSTSTVVALAIFYAERGRFDEAVVTLQQAIATRPRGYEAHELLARIYLQQGEYARLIDDLGPHLTAGADVTEARIGYAIALARSGRNAEAIEQWQLLLHTDSDNPDFHLLLAESLLAVEDFAAATAEYRRVRELRPHDATAAERLEQLTRWQNATHPPEK